jgi:hypothetical protein
MTMRGAFLGDCLFRGKRARVFHNLDSTTTLIVMEADGTERLVRRDLVQWIPRYRKSS